MTLKTTIALIAGVYHVQVGLNDAEGSLTPRESDAINKLGEPIIAVGGDIALGEETFELPEVDARFPSQFPVKQLFAKADYTDAAARATAYRTAIEAGITTAMAALLNTSLGLTGTWITPIDPLA